MRHSGCRCAAAARVGHVQPRGANACRRAGRPRGRRCRRWSTGRCSGPGARIAANSSRPTKEPVAAVAASTTMTASAAGEGALRVRAADHLVASGCGVVVPDADDAHAECRPTRALRADLAEPGDTQRLSFENRQARPEGLVIPTTPALQVAGHREVPHEREQHTPEVLARGAAWMGALVSTAGWCRTSAIASRSSMPAQALWNQRRDVALPQSPERQMGVADLDAADEGRVGLEVGLRHYPRPGTIASSSARSPGASERPSRMTMAQRYPVARLSRAPRGAAAVLSLRTIERYPLSNYRSAPGWSCARADHVGVVATRPHRRRALSARQLPQTLSGRPRPLRAPQPGPRVSGVRHGELQAQLRPPEKGPPRHRCVDPLCSTRKASTCGARREGMFGTDEIVARIEGSRLACAGHSSGDHRAPARRARGGGARRRETVGIPCALRSGARRGPSRVPRGRKRGDVGDAEGAVRPRRPGRARAARGPRRLRPVVRLRALRARLRSRDPTGHPR